MPIITEIGRKAWNIRLLIWSVYAVLSIGSVTMVYPFLMMMSLSVSSDADYKENQLVPRYFYSEDAQFRKFVNIKYLELEIFNKRHHSSYADFGYGGEFKSISSTAVDFPHIVAIPFDLADPRIKARVDDYDDWKRSWIKDHWVFTDCLFSTDRRKATINPLLDRYVEFLLGKYKTLDGINDAYYEENRLFREIYAIREQPTFRTYLPGQGVKFDDWEEFKEQLAAKDLEFINIGDIENEWGTVLQSKFGNEEKFNATFGTNYKSLYAVPLSFTVPPGGATDAERQTRDLWIDFARNSCPLRYMRIRNGDASYRSFLAGKYGEVGTLNDLYETKYASFDEIRLPADISYNKTETADIYDFLSSDRVRPEDITIAGPRWYWMRYLADKYGTLEAANNAHSIAYGDWGEVELPRRLPLNETPTEQENWKRFVVEVCPIDDLLGNFDRSILVSYLRSEYQTVEKLNAAWGGDYSNFTTVSVPKRERMNDAQRADLRRMLSEQVVPLFDVNIPETVGDPLYQDFVKGLYASIADYNRAIRLYPSWDEVQRPIDEIEWADFVSKRREFMKEYFLGNYRAVVNYMALHGRAFINTIILCAAMIIASLTVNPLCAYALSRFQLSYANSILLFLLATMAFPLAVTQIPNFLLLKEARMLNTYWALILPSLANGYSIFLLKGFFDSLPQELFEAGLIDGASEVQMFYRIALPLTTPILAVIALGAFTAAYGQFMWAFVVCQNPKYWTIMVFLYEFQAEHSTPLLMAGLVLASLPTLVVFVAAQKVILKGIVVPQMK